LIENAQKPVKLTELASMNSPEDFLLVFPNPSEIEGKFG
jgi:hypothetical protein